MGKADHLGEFEQLALLAVMRLGDDSYGVRIQEELETTCGRSASISTIYITLTRLEEKGMVSSWMGDPTLVRGGKARRHFRVEPAGLAALHKVRENLQRMWAGLEEQLEQGARLASE